ncbi:unnamed protein product [Soboliphyme baturini]|uniref:IGFBP N-terminal domain-containing protein n=1 Tax=Soboliphyme baturini TaxID=241478 RepID=A0A183INX7_9BILA|nr:unnamed protein product [Soboliphyme baturini]
MSLPLLTKLATGLLLWVSLNTVSFAVEPCGRCDESACDTSPKLCPSGMVRDRCDCCQVCGLNDGEECDVDVVNDQRGYFARKRYSPVHGRCGNHLKCIVQEPNEEVKRVTDSAKCVCDDLKKSVQARGGPENYEISAWVQIEKMSPEDVGTYTCIAKNKLGKSTASCTVVIQSGTQSAFL